MERGDYLYQQHIPILREERCSAMDSTVNNMRRLTWGAMRKTDRTIPEIILHSES